MFIFVCGTSLSRNVIFCYSKKIIDSSSTFFFFSFALISFIHTLVFHWKQSSLAHAKFFGHAKSCCPNNVALYFHHDCLETTFNKSGGLQAT